MTTPSTLYSVIYIAFYIYYNVIENRVSSTRFVSFFKVASFSRFLDNTKRHTTVGRTPLDEGLAHRRDLYQTKHNTHKRQDIHAPGGILTRNPSKRTAPKPSPVNDVQKPAGEYRLRKLSPSNATIIRNIITLRGQNVQVLSVK